MANPAISPFCRLAVRRIATAPSTSAARNVATRVSPVEIAQVADEAMFITGTALTMCAMVLVVSGVSGPEGERGMQGPLHVRPRRRPDVPNLVPVKRSTIGVAACVLGQCWALTGLAD